MLIDVFELLTTARESIASNVAAIDASCDFFIAEVDFETAIIGGGGSASEAGESPVVAQSGGH